MRFDKISKLPPILDFEGLLADFSGLRFDISRLSFALAPQVDRIATDIEQLARLTFVETIQLDRLHHFLSEVVAIGFSHEKRVDAIGTSLVYVLTTMNTAIAQLMTRPTLYARKLNFSQMAQHPIKSCSSQRHAI